MPIHLNFITKQEEREIKTTAVLAWLKNFLHFLLAAFLVFDGFLCLIFFIFHDQVKVIDRITSDSGQRYAFYNDEIKKINDRAAQLNLAGMNFGLLTSRFWSIVNSVPQDIKITNIVLDIKDTSMSIPGIAKTRDALISYENTLSLIPWVDKTSLPKSQLLKKDEVPFQILLNLKQK